MDILSHFRGLFLGLGVGERIALGHPDDPAQSYLQTLLNASTPASVRLVSPEHTLIALLPTLLQHSDQPEYWQAWVQHHFPTAPQSEWRQTALGLASILATVLADPAQPSLRVLPRSLAQIQTAKLDPIPLLTTVQTLLQGRAGLRDALTILCPPSPQPDALSPLTLLAFACYGWLSTANCFTLSLQRVRQLPAPPVVTVWVAALSGFGNTDIGIPALELLRLERHEVQALEAAADRLYCDWAGIQRMPTGALDLRTVAIAPPIP